MKLIDQKSDPQWTIGKDALGRHCDTRLHRLFLREATAEVVETLRRLMMETGRANASEYGGVATGRLMLMGSSWLRRFEGINRAKEYWAIEITLRESTLSYLEPPAWIVEGEVHRATLPLYQAIDFRNVLPTCKAFPAAA